MPCDGPKPDFRRYVLLSCSCRSLHVARYPLPFPATAAVHNVMAGSHKPILFVRSVAQIVEHGAWRTNGVSRGSPNVFVSSFRLTWLTLSWFDVSCIRKYKPNSARSWRTKKLRNNNHFSEWQLDISTEPNTETHQTGAVPRHFFTFLTEDDPSHVDTHTAVAPSVSAGSR